MKTISTKNILTSALSGGIMALITTMLMLNIYPTQNNETANPTNKANISKLLNKEFLTEEDLITSSVEKASPAVVSIVITKDMPVLEEYYETFNSPFDELFFGGRNFNFKIPKMRESGETEKKEIGGGSGFIVSEDGYIITNKHVVDEKDADYTVFTNDGEKYDAKVIDQDALNDIAILKIEKSNLPFLEFEDSEKLKPGQTAIAIGNPLLEFQNSVSVGVISGLSRQITASTSFFGKSEQLDNVIQTDAAINPGNSGGPLLNINGNVIGVNVAVGSGENLGFSIPSNEVKAIFDSVKENGKIVRPFLGIRYIQVTKALKEKNSLTVDYGAIVLRGESMDDLAVVPGSPADKAGIQENDIILEIDGEKLEKGKSLAKIVASKKVGQKIKLKLLHKGKEKEITVKLTEPKED